MRRRPRSPHRLNNPPERAPTRLLWRDLLEIGMEILQNSQKFATSAFLRERQKTADMSTGGRPRLVVSWHRYNKRKFCVTEVPWNAGSSRRPGRQRRRPAVAGDVIVVADEEEGSPAQCLPPPRVKKGDARPRAWTYANGGRARDAVARCHCRPAPRSSCRSGGVACRHRYRV